MTPSAEHPSSTALSPASPGRRAMYMELTKARLSGLVLVTTAVGYLLGLPSGVNWLDASREAVIALFTGDWSTLEALGRVSFGSINWLTFAMVLIGAGLAAGGTSALNQWLEVERDAAMPRTADRPLPSGAMKRSEAFLSGSVMVLVGAGLLFFGVNPLAGFLTLFTATLYILVYTPMKPRSTLNTLVGAVCGAVPPMIGWAAASGTLSLGAWLLGAILFVWQLPHFLALAWMYRDDYARGGFRMLPAVDPSGELTGRIVVITTMLLLPLGLMMMMALRTQPTQGWSISAGLTGWGGLVFAIVSTGLTLYFLLQGWRLFRERTRDNARRVFLASILYLPLVLLVLVLDQPRPPAAAQAAFVQMSASR